MSEINLTPQSITITEAAAIKLKQRLDQYADSLGIRISVKKNGCNGFAYVLDYVDNNTDVSKDIAFESQNIKIWVNSNASGFIGDLTLDWIKSGINEGLSFSNSLETGRCGCGESFSI
jgi:iron-sulfur cluster assembly protein